MSYNFTPDDLPLLNVAMRAFPHVGDGFRALIDVGSRLTFPVESAEELQRVVQSTSIRYGGSDLQIDALPALMPAYYFPVDSVEDLFAKVSDVTSRLREADGPGLVAIRLREPVAPRRAKEPAISDDEIRKHVGHSEIAVPSMGGISKRK